MLGAGYHPDDLTERSEVASWYRDKAHPRSSACSLSCGVA